jgi:hypothetical protein
VSSISQEIGVGYTVVHLPWSCKILTTELVVYSAATVKVEGSIPLVTTKDWSVEISKLAEDIGEIHRLNLSRLEIDFTQYAESVRVSRKDIAEVEDSIRSFKRIEKLTRYNPVNFDWEEPMSVNNVMTAFEAVVMLIVVIVPIVNCCRCCSCCKSVFEFLGKLVSGLVVCCKCCFGCVRAQVKQVEDNNNVIVLEPTAETSKSTTWQIEVVEERLVMFAELPSGLIYYNCLENVVENQLGYVLKGQGPPVDMINRYWLQFDRLPPPSLIVRTLDGKE